MIVFISQKKLTEKRTKIRQGGHWSPSPSEFLNLNIDKSAIDNPAEAGVGGIVRSDESSPIIPFSSPIGLDSINEVEITALRTGLQKAYHLNVLFNGSGPFKAP